MALLKKKAKTPPLPRVPTIPPFPPMKYPFESHDLPSFTSNSNSLRNDFNQDLVKSAVVDSSEDRYDDGIEENYEMPRQQEEMKFEPIRNPVAQRQSIFVKVEKFNALQTAIVEIQEQMKNLSKQVELLKDVKTKQIQEINEWDNEMKKINQRLTKIDSDIFGEV